jgi:hypothetical protein
MPEILPMSTKNTNSTLSTNSETTHDPSSSIRCQKMTKKFVANVRKKLKGMKIPAHRTQYVENLLTMFEQKPDIDFPVLWYHAENPINESTRGYLRLTKSLLHYIEFGNIETLCDLFNDQEYWLPFYYVYLIGSVDIHLINMKKGCVNKFAIHTITIATDYTSGGSCVWTKVPEIETWT